MAAYYTKNERSFESLEYRLTMNDEKICVGLRKTSDLTEEVNSFLEESVAAGTIYDTAERYKIADAVLDP